MVAQNSKMDARAIKPLQSVDAAGDNGNVAPQQAGGGKDGCTGRVQAPVAPGSTPPAAGDTPSSEEVENTKQLVAEAVDHMDGTLAVEPCAASEQPAVDSRPQAVLDVVANNQNEEQEAPKSTIADQIEESGNNRTDSELARSSGQVGT